MRCVREVGLCREEGMEHGELLEALNRCREMGAEYQQYAGGGLEIPGRSSSAHSSSDDEDGDGDGEDAATDAAEVGLYKLHSLAP
jgi:hypothetical protein